MLIFLKDLLPVPLRWTSLLVSAMLVLFLTVTLWWAFASFCIAGPNSAPSSLGDILPRGYIVEFADDAEQHLAKRAKRSHRSFSVHEEFHEYMARSITVMDRNAKQVQRKRGVLDVLSSALTQVVGPQDQAAGRPYTTRESWDHAGLFRGVSVLLASDHHASLLAKAPGVISVSPIRIYAAPKTFPAAVSGEAILHISQHFPQTWDPFGTHRMTGVDRVHAEGLLGKDIVIGILDSGIDYTHPALNGGKPSGAACFGQPECQVIGGANFAQGGRPNDPFDDCSGHGTFVASVAAARASMDNPLTGVAPDAKIRAYRIFDCEVGASTDLIIQALLAAFPDGVHVINMSLSTPGGWPGLPQSALASRIVAKGVAVVTANGNYGQEGAFYSAAPADAINVTAVGSVESIELVAWSIFSQGTSDGETHISMLSGRRFDVPEGKLPVKLVDPSLETKTDACDPDAVAAAGPFNGTVAIVGRGTCDFDVKFKNIFDNGGRHILVYGRPLPAGVFYVDTTIKGLQVATLLREDGLYLKRQLNSGRAVQIDFSRQSLSLLPNHVNGGGMSDFSATGPDWTLVSAAALSAPGGNILGAMPLSEWCKSAPKEQCLAADLRSHRSWTVRD